MDWLSPCPIAVTTGSTARRATSIYLVFFDSAFSSSTYRFTRRRQFLTRSLVLILATAINRKSGLRPISAR